jgi:hypothetical protein
MTISLCYHKYNMKSQWIELKETAVVLRQSGQSIKTIHYSLGVPISTLSGWLKEIEMSNELRLQLQRNKELAWQRAHLKAADWHRTQKALRTLDAKREAQNTLENLKITDETLDLALAVLLFGGGTRSEKSPISSSSPSTLRFILIVLLENYGVRPESISYDLSLRSDQDAQSSKKYWSKELAVPLEKFRSVTIDKRTAGKPTNNQYKGVCIINFSSVAIQRKLRYLYTLFCERIADIDLGT